MEFYEVIRKRRSIRKYKSSPISDEILNRILEAGRIAPSAKNFQPWHFIVIKDPEIKRRVAEASRGQHWMADADVIICGCVLEKLAWGRMGGYMSSFAVDLAIAMDHIILAATNEGLATCWIGAFDEKKVKEILEVPEDVRIVALTPIGYPAEEPREQSRVELKEIISYERYFSKR